LYVFSAYGLRRRPERVPEGQMTVAQPGDLYVFSGPIVLVLVLVLVLGWGIEAGLPGWKREERRKQAAEGSLGSPEKRTRTKDEDEHDWDMALNTYGDLSPGSGTPWGLRPVDEATIKKAPVCFRPSRTSE
jgi:hypothetical protein